MFLGHFKGNNGSNTWDILLYNIEPRTDYIFLEIVTTKQSCNSVSQESKTSPGSALDKGTLLNQNSANI